MTTTEIYMNGTITSIYWNESTSNSSIDNVTAIHIPTDQNLIKGLTVAHVDASLERVVITLLFFIALISTAFNAMVLILYGRNKSLHSPMNLMFVNLAISDLTVAVFGTWFEFFYTCIERKQSPNTFACDFYGVMTFTGGMASLYNLMVIAFARYLTVVRPFGMGNLTYMSVSVLVVIAWGLSLIWGLPPLFGWSDYVPESVGYYCSINWLDESARSYITCLFIFGYVLPVGLIVFSYGSVLAKVKEVAKSQGQGATSTAAKAEKTITKMSIIMVSCFVFAWTPYAIVAMGATYGSPEAFTAEIAVFPAIFAKSANCYNPIIYVFMNKQFREAMILLIFRGKNPFERRKVAPEISGATVGNTTVGTDDNGARAADA